MKVSSRLMAMFLCLLIGVTSFSPARAEVKLKASIGFNGRYKEGKWVPVFIEVENQGPAVDGEFIVTAPAGISFKDTPLPYTLPAHLGPNSTSQFTMYISSRGSFYRFFTQVKFLSQGEVIASTGESLSAEKMQRIKVTPVSGTFALLVSGEKKVELPDKIELYDIVLQQVNISVEDLPDKWIGLDSVDLIIISTEQIFRLNKYQEKALINWVATGRRIIISGSLSPQALEKEFFKRLLPVTIEGRESLSELKSLSELSSQALQGEDGFLVTKGRLKWGSSAIYEEGNIPLVSKKMYGLGQVIYLAFDFQSPPFLAWEGGDNFWKKLIANVEEQLGMELLMIQRYDQEWRFDTEVMELAGKVPEMRIPPLGIIFVFLIIYILVLVPGTHLILKKLNRKELNWLVIPALVVIFSIIFYLYGRNFKGKEVVVSEISITSSSPDHPQAFVTSYLGIFSPAKDAYNLSLQDKDIFIKEIASKPYQEPFFRRSEYRILQGKERKITGLSINKWAMKGFKSDRIVQSPSVGLSFISKNGSWKLMVSNNSSYDLVDGQLNYQGKETFIGNIKSGEKIEIEPQEMEKLIKYSGPHAQKKQELIDILKGIRRISRRGRWGYGSPYKKALVESPYPVLLAWTEEPISKMGLDKMKSRREGLSLFLFHLLPEDEDDQD